MYAILVCFSAHGIILAAASERRSRQMSTESENFPSQSASFSHDTAVLLLMCVLSERGGGKMDVNNIMRKNAKLEISMHCQRIRGEKCLHIMFAELLWILNINTRVWGAGRDVIRHFAQNNRVKLQLFSPHHQHRKKWRRKRRPTIDRTHGRVSSRWLTALISTRAF